MKILGYFGQWVYYRHQSQIVVKHVISGRIAATYKSL